MIKDNCSTCFTKHTRREGKMCKTCDMHLEDQSRDFCSKRCRSLYYSEVAK
jgi:hypothetical protein